MFLKVDNVSKRFGGLLAVSKVSFNVKEGEILGVIGPNGSGKTTLINMISGTIPVTEGAVYYQGKSINDLKPFQRTRLGIGRTFQVVKPLQNMTVRENVMTAAVFGTQNVSTAREIMGSLNSQPIRAAFKETNGILELVGLMDKADNHASNLTLPELKCLEVARALATDATLLLLDEVMAGLNRHEIEGTMELILRVNRERKTTFLVIEHIMKAIMGISHRVVVLHNGNLIANGSPEDVVRDPEVVSAYLGSRFQSSTESARSQGKARA